MKQRKLKDYNRYAYLFILPFFITFLIFQLYPVLYTLFISFTDMQGWSSNFNLVGLSNYSSLLSNDLFLKAVKNTFIIWTVNFIPQIILSLILASWFTSVKLKLQHKSFFQTVIYIPNIITAASVAVIFYSLFAYPVGPVNQILIKLGVLDKPFEFFRSVTATRGMVSFIQFWMWYGQTTIILMSGILAIDVSMFEAAMVDGANERQIFFNITLPQLKPILLYVLVTSLIGGLQMFDIPHLLTGGRPDNSVLTMTMYIYNQAFTGSRNFNVASTASVILLIISIVLSALMFRVLKERATGNE